MTTSRAKGGDHLANAASASAATDYRYDPQGLASAAITLERIAAILALRSSGDAADTEPSHVVRFSRLPPAYRDAITGELRLLRAQLYATGLFTIIENVPLE
jgi:hypothetical protein